MSSNSWTLIYVNAVLVRLTSSSPGICRRCRLPYPVVVVAWYLQSSSFSVAVQPSDGTVKSTLLHRVETGQPTSSSWRSDVIYRTSRHRPVVGGRQRRPVADHRRRRRHGRPRRRPARRTTRLGVLLETRRLGRQTSTVAVASSSPTTAPSSKVTPVFITNAACLLVDPSTHRPDRIQRPFDSPFTSATPECWLCGDLPRGIWRQ